MKQRGFPCNHTIKKKRILLWAGILVFMLSMLLTTAALANDPPASADDRGSRDFWLQTYGQIEENPFSLRARDVYNKVLSAADRRVGLNPELYIINSSEVPWAQSLADGAIILTKNCLNFCYQGQNPEKGDARLAFVIGHELAHQFNGDFWAYHFIRSLGMQERFAYPEVQDSAMNPELLQSQELAADQYGILYAALAGYRTDEIVAFDKNFFIEWMKARRLQPGKGHNNYPSPEKRAVALISHLKEVVDHLVLFHLGVISYHLGWYEEAAGLFEKFSRFYPAREVYTNLGTVYLQIAYEKYCASQEKSNLPFVLSFGLEADTRAQSITVSACSSPNRDYNYKSYLSKAAHNLAKGKDHDPFYGRAKNNLGCAYLMEGKYNAAIAILKEALPWKENAAQIKNNLAIARFLFGREVESAKLIAQAKEAFTAVADINPAAKQNLQILYQMEEGTQSVSTTRPCPLEIFEKPQKVHQVIKKLSPGQALPQGNYHQLEEVLMENLGKLQVIVCPDEQAIILQEKGLIKLIAYKESSGAGKGSLVLPDEITQPNTRTLKDSHKIVISKEKRQGRFQINDGAWYFFSF